MGNFFSEESHVPHLPQLCRWTHQSSEMKRWPAFMTACPFGWPKGAVREFQTGDPAMVLTQLHHSENILKCEQSSFPLLYPFDRWHIHYMSISWCGINLGLFAMDLLPLNHSTNILWIPTMFPNFMTVGLTCIILMLFQPCWFGSFFQGWNPAWFQTLPLSKSVFPMNWH